MNDVQVNYVVAAYFGDRVGPTEAYRRDPTSYLREHLRSLGRLEHHLRQITVVLSSDEGGDLCPEWMPASIGTADVSFRQRPNKGMSYGAFSDAVVDHLGDLRTGYFTHFIFMEDDYVFTHDHFDELIVEEQASRPDCGFLCGETSPDPDNGGKVVAGAFLGVAKRGPLLWICDRNGRLPYSDGGHSYIDGVYGQKQQSFQFQYGGYTVESWLSRWSTAYYNAHVGEGGLVRWFGRTDSRAMVVPVQVLDRDVLVTDGYVVDGPRAKARIGRDGSLCLEDGHAP